MTAPLGASIEARASQPACNLSSLEKRLNESTDPRESLTSSGLDLKTVSFGHGSSGAPIEAKAFQPACNLRALEKCSEERTEPRESWTSPGHDLISMSNGHPIQSEAHNVALNTKLMSRGHHSSMGAGFEAKDMPAFEREPHKADLAGCPGKAARQSS